MRADYPVDDIWRAVLAGDDEALANLDVETGPVHLLTERRATGVEVVRLEEPAWRFMAELCAGHSMQAALEIAAGFDCSIALAEHLALGRFVGFGITYAAVTTTR